jgi:hypothetical protein
MKFYRTLIISSIKHHLQLFEFAIKIAFQKRKQQPMLFYKTLKKLYSKFK